MVFSEEDRQALYNVWMSQKAKMHLTQMEMARRLNLTQLEFSLKLIRYTFIARYPKCSPCNYVGIGWFFTCDRNIGFIRFIAPNIRLNALVIIVSKKN